MRMIITQTRSSKSAAAARVLVALPLLVIGSQHLLGVAPLEPILRGAGIPFPELNAMAAPLMQIFAGALLLSGYLARVGAALTVPAMAVGIYTHVVFDWTDEPPIALPILMIGLAGYVLWKGAGALSLDLRMINGSLRSGPSS